MRYHIKFHNLQHRSKVEGMAFVIFIALFFLLSTASLNAADQNTSKISKKNNSKNTPSISILKADEIHGDKVSNRLDAIGNAELIRDGNIINSDKMSYEKNDKMVKATGNVKVTNFQLGNVLASYADIKDDLTSGHFNDARIIFNDGSYIKSPLITKVNKNQTVLDKAIFSICPNPEIAEDNAKSGEVKDLFSLKSKKTVIDKESNAVKISGAIFRVYNVPVFYTPYIRAPIPSSERKSGFLHPSYTKSTRLGFGIDLPYYWNIAPDKDLTIAPKYHPTGNHLIVTNDYRQLTKKGAYNVKLELANNKKLNSTVNMVSDVNNREIKGVRKYLNSVGDFKLSENSGLNFAIDYAGDKHYLRDYHNALPGFTVSEVNLDHIEQRDYYGIKTVKIQELEPNKDDRTAPFALPIMNSYFESKPGLIGQKYSLLGNATAISKQVGLQYRRASLKPEVTIPFNYHGNLFKAKAGIQADFYNLQNSSYAFAQENHFKRFTANYRPEMIFDWSLPLIRKSKNNTIVLEPMANFISSSFRNNFNKIPNEDSNNSELTQSNLFSDDRFTGFDRNESGQRMSYGVKTSLHNSLGQFGLGLGQSYRRKDKVQDVKIRGFNETNISNIVGEFSYKSKKIFSIIYNFHLNESNYRNEVNEVSSGLNFGKISFGANYLLLRRNTDNITRREQLDLNSTINITAKWLATVDMSRNLVTGKTLSRKLLIQHSGCCVMYGFSVSESNPSDFIKPERSYNIVFTIKNL